MCLSENGRISLSSSAGADRDLQRFRVYEKTVIGMAPRCQFWLPVKKRSCANIPLNNSSFCGNHTIKSDGQWITCPIDPSHSVLQENLASHLKRCPLLKQAQSLSCQPYYHKGINSGTPDQNQPTFLITALLRRKAVFSRTVSEFLSLISKIKSIHSSIANNINQDSFKIPEACVTFIGQLQDRKLPFKEKHVLQQGSIVGNLEDFGLVEKQNDTSSDGNDVPAVVEFGAGRGYLTQMLADCYGIKKVLLVERRSYKFKADRSLRQIESLERLRIDIEDLNLNAVKSIQGSTYLALGKHLCGAATDMTLKCCICQPRVEDCADELKTRCFLKGLAIATCCHHLCQWEHYINQRYILSLGLTKEDFHSITWFTSWAVDADHQPDLSAFDGSDNMDRIENEEIKSESNELEVGDIIKGMKVEERAQVGFMCKDIIDAGRWMWIKEQGLEAQMVKYVPPSISPENRLLVARFC